VKRPGVSFALASAVLALLVALAGLGIAGVGVMREVAGGALVGWAVQAALFALCVEWLFPGRLVPAYVVGMLSRLLLIAVAAWIWVPLAGLEAAPTLLSLVAVLFLTTVLEPVLFAAAERQARPGVLNPESKLES
jgi:hypothetical protein